MKIQIYINKIAQLLGDAGNLGIPENEFNMVALSKILNGIYAIAGVIGVIVLIIAGITYVTSSGDPSKATKAKNRIVYTGVGLVIVLGAFAITNFVLGRV